MLDFKEKPILGMIHLSGVYPVQQALEEIVIYENAGVNGAIVENYHGGLDEVIEVLQAIPLSTKIDIGINILPNEFATAFELADKYGATFIQLDFISGRYLGLVSKELDLEKYMIYRLRYPNIKVLGGVWPKYYTPLSNLEEDLVEAQKRCDAIVVTGSGTGKETPLGKIKSFRQSIGDFPLIIGAGLNQDNLHHIEYADGAIVGSAFKRNNNTNQKITEELVINFINKKKQYEGKNIKN